VDREPDGVLWFAPLASASWEEGGSSPGFLQWRGRRRVFLLTTVALPLVFVVVMALVEQLGDRGQLDDRLIKVGWDMCVLALGVAGGVCLSPGVIRTYGEQGAVIAGFFSIALSFGAAVLIALLRRQKPQSWWLRPARPLGALALGGAALTIPTYLAF
jgi:hypothetical protein